MTERRLTVIMKGPLDRHENREGSGYSLAASAEASVDQAPSGVGQTAVFLNPATGKPYTAGSVSMAFQCTCQNTGLTNARCHNLRHTFVINARRANIDYFRLMAITGRKTLRVFQHYNLIDEGDLQEAMTSLQT